MKSVSMIIASALLVGPLAMGCDDGTNGTPTDTSTDTGTDQPSSCRQDQDPLNPHYRMTRLDITSPDRLDNPSLEVSIVREALNGETFLWLFRFEGVDDGTTDTDGTLAFETGGGVVSPVDHNGCYQFLSDPLYPIRNGNLSISGDHVGWPTDEPSFNIDIPIFNWDYEFLLKLPLKDVRIISGNFSADRSTLGDDTVACDVELTGVITVADSQEVFIPDMNQHLCAVLSGDVGDPSDPEDDCTSDPSTWDAQPDTDYMGEPAYSMSGCFSAEQVIVVD